MYVNTNTVHTYSNRKERSMDQTPYSTPKPRNSYELVGHRLQRIIASPPSAEDSVS